MKIKSILASVAACAIAASALAVTASADILNANADANYQFPIIGDTNNLPEGCKITDIYGFSCKFDKVAGEGETCVGAFAWNDDTNWSKWNQSDEFCQEGGDKKIFIASDGSVKFVNSAPLFTDAVTAANGFVCEWAWDGDNQIDVNVSDFKLLDKDGNVLGAAAPAETTSAAAAAGNDGTTTSSTTTTTTTTTTTAAGSNTGDAGAAVAIAGLAIAGAAAFVARKKD